MGRVFPFHVSLLAVRRYFPHALLLASSRLGKGKAWPCFLTGFRCNYCQDSIK